MIQDDVLKNPDVSAIIGLRVDSAIPVSYTHLDVYKRQHENGQNKSGGQAYRHQSEQPFSTLNEAFLFLGFWQTPSLPLEINERPEGAALRPCCFLFYFVTRVSSISAP